MENINSIFSVLILLSAFWLMATKRVKSYITTLRVQAVLIAAATLTVGINNIINKGDYALLVVSLVIVALKVVYIPGKLHRTRALVEYKVEKDFLMNIPMLVIMCCGIVVLTYFSLSNISLLAGPGLIPLVNAISMVLIGLFFIISRKKAIGHIVGLLVIENGLFVTALFATNGMPFIVDMGIFVDIITSVLILGIMVFKINDSFESIDIDKLQSLRG
jgi:hydrogenase-4 component E